MRGGALPPALLFAALGLALAFAPRKSVPWCLVLTVVAAVLAGMVKVAAKWNDDVFLGCWVSLIITAASVHLPRGLNAPLVLILALNTGIWGGAVISASGGALDYLKSLPFILLCFPAGWLVATKRQIVIKVLSSWLIAVALLALTLQITTPTPGYVPDHMD